MNDEIELISDGDGLAVIGDPATVELFLSSAELSSRPLDLSRIASTVSTGSGVAHAASSIAAASARWVQVSENSAHLMKTLPLMTGSTGELGRAVLTVRDGGQISNVIEIVKDSTGFVTNPALLAGAAGIMAQLAMQQAMDEITDYLAVIDAKVDDVLRAQKDAALADMIAVGIVIDEAMTLREHVGRVSEITWSKVQTSSMAIARTQAYALRQLDALAERLEKSKDIKKLAGLTKSSEREVQQWLAVLARCFQLEDGIGVLEFDRVLDAAPDELERHRLGLRNARRKRRELISSTTERLMARIDAVAGSADDKVLFSPFSSPAVVKSTNQIALTVVAFHGLLGIDDGRQSLEATRWRDAAGDLRDGVLEAGADGVDAAVRLGRGTLDRARSLTNRIASDVADRTRRPQDDED